MTGSVTVRRIGTGDVSAVLAMIDALNAVTGEPPLTAEPAALETFLAAERLYGFVAMAGDTPVGYTLGYDGVTTEFLEPGAYLVDLFVAAEWRQRGIGRRLVDAFCALAAERGGTHIWWLTQKDNTVARATYQSLGASTEEMTAHALTHTTFADAARRGSEALAA